MTTASTIEERFWSKVDKSGDCWVWTACTNRKGYGWFGGAANGKRRNVMAHRFSCELVNGPLPEGQQLHHVCKNKLCVNPAHLVLMSPGEHSTLTHTTREYKKGYTLGPRQKAATCHKGHLRSEYGHLRVHVQGWQTWRCRLCSQAHDQKRREARH